MTPDDYVGQVLGDARARTGMTQQVLGGLMRSRGWSWSQSTVWATETGRRPLGLIEAAELCEILDLSVDALLAVPADPTELASLSARVEALERALSEILRANP